MEVKVEFQEPDKKKNIKRIIAREGLILLVSVVLFFIGLALQSLNDVFVVIGFFNYPAYLLVRFIIWAVRTLKEK